MYKNLFIYWLIILHVNREFLHVTATEKQELLESFSTKIQYKKFSSSQTARRKKKTINDINKCSFETRIGMKLMAIWVSVLQEMGLISEYAAKRQVGGTHVVILADMACVDQLRWGVTWFGAVRILLAMSHWSLQNPYSSPPQTWERRDDQKTPQRHAPSQRHQTWTHILIRTIITQWL